MYVQALVVAALLVHRAHMRLQVARRREGLRAHGALVVAALLVHLVHMPLQGVLPRKALGALRPRARVLVLRSNQSPEKKSRLFPSGLLVGSHITVVSYLQPSTQTGNSTVARRACHSLSH